jgi:hypothetical protein
MYSLFEKNDRKLAWSCAFDYRLLSRGGVQIDMTFEVTIESSEPGLDVHVRSRTIVIESLYPGVIRLDRLLARQLRISRTFVQELYDNGGLRIHPDSRRALSKAAYTGQRVFLSVAEKP